MPYKNKELQKISAKKHYEKNKQKIIEKAKLHTGKKRKEIRLFIDEFKHNKGCNICGINDCRVLEFHHTEDNKDINISEAISKGWSLERLQGEIDKCIVVCANCHRILHWNKKQQ